MGNPCVNVPALPTASGLPVGVQVIAAFGRDDKALARREFLERAIRSLSLASISAQAEFFLRITAA